MKTQKSPVTLKRSQFCHVHSLVATLDDTAAAQPGQVTASGRSPQTRGRAAGGAPPPPAAGGCPSLPSRGAASPAGRGAERMAMSVRGGGGWEGGQGVGHRERAGAVVAGQQRGKE